MFSGLLYSEASLESRERIVVCPLKCTVFTRKQEWSLLNFSPAFGRREHHLCCQMLVLLLLAYVFKWPALPPLWDFGFPASVIAASACWKEFLSYTG